MYKVKEIYKTLQGEGAHAGRTAVFCRFTGCNLWSGREEDRAKALCSFCDTEFNSMDGQNGGKYNAIELLNKLTEVWSDEFNPVYVVFTGGEPLLQLDQELIHVLKAKGFYVAVETNGTLELPQGIDWVCMSPKPGKVLKVTSGDEIKIVYPQKDVNPLDFEKMAFEHYYIQPLDDECQEENVQQAVRFCIEHPQWKLSLQLHKILNIS